MLGLWLIFKTAVLDLDCEIWQSAHLRMHTTSHGRLLGKVNEETVYEVVHVAAKAKLN